MRDTMQPVLEKAGMSVAYRTDEKILNADSLARFDVLFIYNAKKGSKTDNTPDLTTAQENALYAWVEAGHAVVAVHCASSSYLENPRYAELIGASYTEHGPDLQYITISRPDHPAMIGVSPPTGWDEGRLHKILRQDLIILATANAEKTPWTWVHPQGKGWVYYTCSGHDERVWRDADFQGMLVQAVKWGYAAGTPATKAIALPFQRHGQGPFRSIFPSGDALGRTMPRKADHQSGVFFPARRNPSTR